MFDYLWGAVNTVVYISQLAGIVYSLDISGSCFFNVV
jgi:hypothetical protein